MLPQGRRRRTPCGKRSERFPDEARCRNEARAVNIIRHPGVVDIYEHGQLPDGTIYLVMEYLEGRSLRDTLAEDLLTEAQAVLLGQQLASALATAHSKGIIHRDLFSRCARVRQRHALWALEGGWKQTLPKAWAVALRGGLQAQR
jgi:serine/threonine protein kinase